jgi:photosystem II stability/assembly factor-like uncharacterized protein
VLLFLLAVGVAVFVTRDDDSSRTVEARGAVPFGPVIPIGDVLLGAESSGHPTPGGVVRSLDGGRTWKRAPLPQQAGGLVPLAVERLDDVVVVAGSRYAERSTVAGNPALERLVWTTRDGRRWHGPLVVERTSSHLGPHIGRLDGRLVTAARLHEGFFVFTSGDGGKAWRRVAVGGLDLIEGESADLRETWLAPDASMRGTVTFSGLVNPAHEGRTGLLSSGDGGATWALVQLCDHSVATERSCRPVLRSSALLLRGLEASLDGGATWTPVSFDPSFKKANAFAVVESVPGGGWLATVTGSSGGGGGPLSWVVRSDDGLHWKALLGPGVDGCPPEPVHADDLHNAVSAPLRAGSRWYVVFSCRTRGIALYGASLDARAFRSIEKLELTGHPYFLTPFRGPDGVVLPVPATNGHLRRLLVVQD